MELPSTLALNYFDLAVVVLYLLGMVMVGFYAARRGQNTTKQYFLGGRALPWYVVGTSMVATVVSTEHFVAQVGAGYSKGLVVAAFGWNAWLVYSLLIWI